ncbi:2-dehydropantoate 2-reductase [Anopheles sinensis]|uniref:2-dehydropantoate 2-reductase n=1 Tax=Anopheles sinensis TaxID=74873 RepID=A0A084W287_ANOSI|nr:2-dehydropantoate 2-reductase [Anopheles sinensis]
MIADRRVLGWLVFPFRPDQIALNLVLGGALGHLIASFHRHSVDTRTPREDKRANAQPEGAINLLRIIGLRIHRARAHRTRNGPGRDT